jgi:polysaccharide biosynthesis protein PslG
LWLTAVATASVVAAVAVHELATGGSGARPPVTAELFGVHQAGLSRPEPRGWPRAPVGTVRLWDDRVAWRDLETAPGVFDWTRVDRQVGRARSHGASVLLVLGQTPRFHTSRPKAPGFYGAGSTAMPARKADWQRYVRAVARRNRSTWGRIGSFQVWNEANNPQYWTGTPAQLARLSAWTRAALDDVDRRARLVGPALAVRLASQRRWIDSYYGQTVGGRPVGDYLDAVALNLYPERRGGPERAMALLAKVRRTLADRDVEQPVWATEIDYGLDGRHPGARVPALDRAHAVGNVVRTFVLAAEHGVARVYWYAWDLPLLGNTPLVGGNHVAPTDAGRAFAMARRWILGARPTGCRSTRGGTWRCSFVTARRELQVVWNTSRPAAETAAQGASTYTSSSGAVRPVGRDGRVVVGAAPVLFTRPR